MTDIVFAAAIILINENGQVLVDERRQDQIYPGYWEFPGGKIEEHEIPDHAAIREMREETGVDVKTITPLTFISEDRGDYHVVVYVFTATEWSGEPSGKEGQVIRWVNMEELETLNLLPANKPLVPLIKYAVQSSQQ